MKVPPMLLLAGSIVVCVSYVAVVLWWLTR